MKHFLIILLIIFLAQSLIFAQTFSFSSVNGGISTNPNAFMVYKNELYVGGGFLEAGGITVNGICSWNGSQWKKVGNGLDHSQIRCFGVYNNLLLMGGPFISVLDINNDFINSNKLVGWDGTNWIPFSLNNNTATDEVRAIAEFQGDLYICGRIFHIGNVAVNRIAKWDGTYWHDIGINVIDSFGPPEVRAMAVFNNELYVGGCFSSINNVIAKNIARWDGNQWHPVGTGTEGCVISFYTDTSNNMLWVGGGFIAAGGLQTNSVAIWDGLNWAIPGIPLTCGAMGITKFKNRIFVGSPGCGPTQPELTYWDGTVWDSIPQITDGVMCLAEYQGALYLGGFFPNNFFSQDYILKMQMTTDITSMKKDEKNLLENNIPNPFSETTTIPYKLLIGTKEAQLSISNIYGKSIKTFDLDLQKTQIEINMNNLADGVYIYSLIVDGKVIKIKKMIMINE